MEQIEQLKCDVLVIGAGLAGCWAALRARELGANVLLVDIGKVSMSGKSSFSGAGILCPQESDDLDVWQAEIVEKGEYLNDQDWVRIILEEHPRRLKEMGEWGLAFEYDTHGNIFRHVGLNHTNTRITTIDSLQMMEVLRERLQELGVTLLERVMITDLLTSDGIAPTDGYVVGAVGFNIRTGETLAINAGATIMAAGGSGYFGSCGEGIIQAYKVGTEITGVEFNRTYDNMGFEDRYLGVHLNTYQRLGMKLVNSAGERFMEKYLPTLKERGKREDLGLAIVSEGMQGKGPIYIDLRHLDAEMNKLSTLPTTAAVIRSLQEEGIDFKTQLVKYVVTSGFILSRAGGIRNNIYGESSIPGLYVAGEAGGFPAHGTYSVGGMNLACCCVGGYRAGEYAAKLAMENGVRAIAQEQASELVGKALGPLKASSGMHPEELADEIGTFLSPARTAVYRDAITINKILERVVDWKAKSQQLKVKDYHELVHANRMINYVQFVELTFKGYLTREETRSVNIRLDFLFKDNINWLKWIVQRNDGNGKHTIKTVPVPIYRYPVKPREYARIPEGLNFPKMEGEN